MKKFFLFCGILVILIAVAVVIRVRSTPKMKIDQNILSAQKSVQAWEKLPFVEVANTQKLRGYLETIPIIEDGNSLSDEQRKALYDSFITMVQAYREGSYEAFLRFRLPQGVPVKPKQKEWKNITACWFQDHPDATAQELPDDSALYRWWIERDQEGVYKDYWQGIMLSASDAYRVLGKSVPGSDESPKVGIYLSHVPLWQSVPVLFSTYNAQGVMPINSSYEFQLNSSSDIQAYASEKFLTAWFYFFVKPVSTDSIIPIYAKYVWDPRTRQWLPIELIRGDFQTIVQSLYFKKKSRIIKF